MPEAATEDRLDSWKKIAGYLNRDVRTVQQWERSRGLPVHRIPGGRQRSIFALPSELDGWCLSGPELYQTAPPEADGPAQLAAWIVLTLAVVLGLVAMWWRWHTGPLPDPVNAATITVAPGHPVTSGNSGAVEKPGKSRGSAGDIR